MATASIGLSVVVGISELLLTTCGLVVLLLKERRNIGNRSNGTNEFAHRLVRFFSLASAQDDPGHGFAAARGVISYFNQQIVGKALAAPVWQLRDLIAEGPSRRLAWASAAPNTTVLSAARVQRMLTLQATEIHIRHIFCGACSLALTVICFSAPRCFTARGNH